MQKFILRPQWTRCAASPGARIRQDACAVLCLWALMVRVSMAQGAIAKKNTYSRRFGIEKPSHHLKGTLLDRTCADAFVIVTS